MYLLDNEDVVVVVGVCFSDVVVVLDFDVVELVDSFLVVGCWLVEANLEVFVDDDDDDDEDNLVFCESRSRDFNSFVDCGVVLLLTTDDSFVEWMLFRRSLLDDVESALLSLEVASDFFIF